MLTLSQKRLPRERLRLALLDRALEDDGAGRRRSRADRDVRRAVRRALMHEVGTAGRDALLARLRLGGAVAAVVAARTDFQALITTTVTTAIAAQREQHDARLEPAVRAAAAAPTSGAGGSALVRRRSAS